MKPESLDLSLQKLARNTLPRCPDRISADVWTEIEKQRTNSKWSRLFKMIDWPESLLKPQLTVAALIFAAVIGAVPAMAVARLENTRSLARQSMHFEVFSVTPPMGMSSPLPRPTSNETKV